MSARPSVNLIISNVDALRAQIEEVGRLVSRAASLSELVRPGFEDLRAQLFDALGEDAIVLVADPKSESALRTLEFAVRAELSPRVLELVAAIRALGVEREHGGR